MPVAVDFAARVAGLARGPLAGIDLEVPAGRLTAVTGRPGAGQDVLLSCLGGLARPDAGTIHIGQQRITGMGDAALTKVRRDRIGYIFATCSLLPTLSVGQNIRIAPELAGRKPDQAWYDRVTALLELTPLLRLRPAVLTPLERQRVACARAFLNRPDIVLADEPTSELSHSDAAELLGFLRMWVRKLDQAILLATTEPEVAVRADLVLVLDNGRITRSIERPTLTAVREALA
ncbi:ABC transporter ATP-binding protein [Actinocrispum sp. NPDC049592]|uniref:ABC transporter ATP-binding protein n=1 Tax=Actinocrispum sp. NPDC049592 TaxID=3154835 RepID=UPI003449F7D8